ncbi:general secretion pathway protein GspL [Ramlibacter sp. G-1-2-2]|uniref:General secretion pathway protein GspL n=1 Tax=Ramlibacter agri TaxID=2728837 RepID=A0A848HFZ4_9BURK|nr:type II secretion system protein GspL [Ramlibacter agri]NML48380.1 general secretion pathway protein GspL [Ramlibacter agri]
MSTLVVSLPQESATGATEWAYALTADGRTPADHGKCAAALLPLPRGAGAEIVAVAPVQALAWHRVDLPKGVGPGSPRLRAALEGLLEERLLDEPEALHLALQPGARGGEPAWIAVCDRAWLRTALQALEGAGRTVTRIVPEFAPEGEPLLAVIGDAQQPLAVAVSPDAVVALPLSQATLPLLPQLPDEAPRLAEPAVAAVAEQLLSVRPELQQAPQRWLNAARTRWDLGQFEFANSSRARAAKKLAAGWNGFLRAPAWRPARWGIATLVVLNLIGLNAWAWKERASLDAKRETVRRTLTDTFPQVKLVIDAPRQMEREVATLRQLTGTASPRDLDALLAALAEALPAGRTPGTLEYSGTELRAGGLGLSGDELREVATRLKPLGYVATTSGNNLVLAVEDVR